MNATLRSPLATARRYLALRPPPRGACCAQDSREMGFRLGLFQKCCSHCSAVFGLPLVPNR
eukprot:6152958-Pyramimonas_sp.AAC.1